jgi:hypothetical protein
MTTRIQEELDRFTADAEYFDAHRQALLARYPEQWVAVFGQEVVATAKDLKRLIAQLERKGIPPAQAYRAYLTDREEMLILASIAL